MSLSAEDFEQNMEAIEAFLALDDVDSVGRRSRKRGRQIQRHTCRHTQRQIDK